MSYEDDGGYEHSRSLIDRHQLLFGTIARAATNEIGARRTSPAGTDLRFLSIYLSTVLVDLLAVLFDGADKLLGNCFFRRRSDRGNVLGNLTLIRNTGRSARVD